jgi:hypothetical protein
VVCALKKLRCYIYRIYFILEIDYKTLVHQLNKPASDLPNSAIARWLAWIRLFTFDIRYVAGKSYTAADSLSRRPCTTLDNLNEKNAVGIDEFIKAQLFTYTIFASETGEEVDVEGLSDFYKQVV